MYGEKPRKERPDVMRIVGGRCALFGEVVDKDEIGDHRMKNHPSCIGTLSPEGDIEYHQGGTKDSVARILCEELKGDIPEKMGTTAFIS